MREDREIEIYILDLLQNMCLQWRKIIVSMILFTFVFNIYGGYKNYKSDKLASQVGNKLTADDYKNVLSDTDKGTVLSYQSYKEQYKSLVDYKENSLLMNLDANNAAHYKLYYLVSNTNQKNSIINHIKNDVLSDELFDTINKDLKLNSAPRYLKELVNVNASIDESIQKSSKYIEISIISNEKDTSVNIANSIKGAIEKDKYFDADKTSIKYEFSDYSNELNNTVRNTQNDIINNMYNTNQQIINIENGLSDVQKEYYNCITNQNNDNVDSLFHISINHFVSVKFALIGAMFGLMLVCCYDGMKYILSSKIHTSEELKDYFDINLFGVINSKDYTGFDEKIIHFLNKNNHELSHDENMSMIVTNIKIALRKRNIKSLHVTSSINDEKVYEAINDIKSEIRDIKVTTGSSILSDSVSLQEMSESDAVIFVEKINESNYKDVDQELYLAKEYNVELLGLVVVQLF